MGPGQCLAGITFRRAARGFTAADRELLEALRAPLAAGLTRASTGAPASAAAAATGAPAPAAAAATDPGAGRFGLTTREHQVLALVAQGRTNLAIAHALGISPRTVGKHLEHSYRKLAVTSRAAAVAALR